MSLFGKVVSRVFQQNLRNNVINCRQRSSLYLLGQSKQLINKYFKPVPYNSNTIIADLSTKTHIRRARAMGALSPLDPSSYSRPELAIVKHISLALNIDFEQHVLSGEAILNFDVLSDIDDLILDVSNLKIQSIETGDGKQLQYKLGEHVPNFGSKLTILLPKQATSGEKKDAFAVTDDADSINAPMITYDDCYYKMSETCLLTTKNYSEDKDTNTEYLIFSTSDKASLAQHDGCLLKTPCPSEVEPQPIEVPKQPIVCDCPPKIQPKKDGLPSATSDGRTDVKPKQDGVKTPSPAECDCLTKTKVRPEKKPIRATCACASKTETPPCGKCKPVIVNFKEVYPLVDLEEEQKDNSSGFISYKASFCGHSCKDKSSNKADESYASSSNKDNICKSRCTNTDAVTKRDANTIGFGSRLRIKIKYSTNPTASALQWLDAAQTSGKKYPYLFSQCQPIHARSILPCQDTPAVKFTYDAEVTAPEQFTVLMSALRGEVKNNMTRFSQPMPLPSYLVALAVGVLESRPLGPRSRVWSEKEEIERSAWEFADTEKYLQAAEKLCGPYEWKEYDLLVLPPSFPYGGMENPCLTFVTPTLLAGDRSQADVIVHEIMHSWTGNLVTNRNFEHFWLNEGFTVYLERKVAASLINDTAEAKRSRDFHSLLGLQELSEAVKDELGPENPLTKLVVDLKGVHPDDAFSTVPYEKGSLFLRHLENLVGGSEEFDDFLRSYLSKFRKKSLDTDQFKEYLLDYFKDDENLKKLDWKAWLDTSGMPPAIPNYDTSMTKAITALIVKVDEPNVVFSYSDVKSFTPHQMIHYLQQLIEKPPLPLEKLRSLGSEYKVEGNTNSEIAYRWLRLCVRSKDHNKLTEVFKFLNSNGRMKYVRPLYRDLYAWEDIRDRAIDNFLKNEKNMMHVSAYTIRKDLHLNLTDTPI